MYPPHELPEPDRLRLPRSQIRSAKPSRRAPRHKRGEKFLKGPIPWAWLCRAARAGLRTKTLHVAIALWFLTGVGKSWKVKLTRSIMNSLGVKPDAASRGLRGLEACRLISVDRQKGRAPVVTILECPKESPDA